MTLKPEAGAAHRIENEAAGEASRLKPPKAQAGALLAALYVLLGAPSPGATQKAAARGAFSL